MSILLGIDTGGSFTDGVIFDSNSKKVLSKTKAPTTKEQLSVGILECIRSLDQECLKHVQLVCVSTTLATNAIVEGKNSPVGLITMHRDRITKNYSAQKNIQVSGQMSIRGIAVEDIDEAEVREALMEMKGAISALAVSGYASVRNPAHELRIKEIAGEILGVPVVCGHELTSVLGYDERTVTAVLNASLMPEIADLVKEIK